MTEELPFTREQRVKIRDIIEGIKIADLDSVDQRKLERIGNKVDIICRGVGIDFFKLDAVFQARMISELDQCIAGVTNLLGLFQCLEDAKKEQQIDKLKE